MKILIVEDERILADSIANHLGKEGFVTEVAYTFDAGAEKVNLYDYDCVIVDINLPDGIGFGLVEALRSIKSTAGIIIISARNSVEDKIKSLDIGSDDYLTKPFHLSELNARVKSLLRRRNFGGSNEITFEEIRINFNARRVFVSNKEITLSRKEYDLLMFFIANNDMALTKASIAEHLWGDHIDSSDSFDILYSHIKNLRKKLSEGGCNDYIQSIYGIGYKFGKA